MLLKTNFFSRGLNFIKTGFAGIVAIFVLILFSTCKIGLGHAVDTQSPTLEVKEPAANAIVRDAFIMSGTYNDDGVIASLTLSIKNTSTQKEVGPLKATVNQKNKTWSCSIDPNAEETKLLDGSYETTLVIEDTYGHKTTGSVAFKIDNTPPLVILSRPSTAKGAYSLDSFGADFFLKGEAVDDNSIDLVEVAVYEANADIEKDAPLKVISLPNVPKAIDNSVATFSTEKYAGSDYEAIFGKIDFDSKGYPIFDDIKAKDLFCVIRAYDDARKVPAEEGDKGNYTEEFYLLSEIKKYLTDGYKSLGFYQIMNGTYNEANGDPNGTLNNVAPDGREYSVNEIKEVIENFKLKAAAFSLDPRANPKYKVSSCKTINEAGKLSGKNAELTNNSTVEVSLIPGLDDYEINKDTVGIYLQECDEDGNILPTAEKITLFEKFKEEAADGTVTTEAGTEYTKAEYEKKFGISGSTKTVSVTISTRLDSRLKIGKYYRFVVEGEDEKENAIRNYGNTDYAFRLKSEDAKPSLEIKELVRGSRVETTSKTSVDLKDNEKLTIKGTAKIGEEADLIPNITVQVGLSTELSSKPETITATKFEVDGWLCDIPAKLKNSTFVIRVIAINPEDTNQTDSKDITVNYDCTGPDIGDITVTPTVEKEISDTKTEEYVNGIITIKSSVEDELSVIEKVEYTLTGKLVGEIEPSTTLRKQVGNISSGDKVNTTLYEDKTQLTVTIYATDKPGNESKKTKILNIDQSTDQPVVVYNNFDPSIKNIDDINDKTAINEINNIFGTQSNNKLSASISDDDGIKKVTLYKNDTAEILLDNGKSTNYALNYPVSNRQGTYDIRIVVEDTKGETSYSSIEIPNFRVAVDEGAPNFSITSPNNALQAKKTSIDVTGTVSDGTPVTIKRYEYVKATAFVEGKKYFTKDGSTYTEQLDLEEFKAGVEYYERSVENESITVDKKDDIAKLTDAEKNKIIIVKESDTWSDIIPDTEVGETGKVLYYEAMDEYGQTTGQTYIYSIDSYPPLFKITKVDSDFTTALEGAVDVADRKEIFVKAGTDKYLQISGNVEDQYSNDSTKSRGLDEFVYYKLTRDETISVTSKETIKDWSTTKKIDSGSWTQAIDLGDEKLTEDGIPNNGVPYILYIVAKDAAGNVSLADVNYAKVPSTATFDANKKYFTKDGSTYTEQLDLEEFKAGVDYYEYYKGNPFSAVYIISDTTKPTVTITSMKVGTAEFIKYDTATEKYVPTADNVQIDGSNENENIVIIAAIKDPVPGKTDPTNEEEPTPTKASGVNSVKLLLDGNEYKYSDGTGYKTANITNSTITDYVKVTTAFDKNKTYYTKSGSTYTEATGITEFATGVDYYEQDIYDEYKITFPAKSFTSGTFSFKISVVDNVGNSQDADVIRISKDTIPPTVTIFDISPEVVDDADNTFFNGKIKVKISANDDVELEKIDWWIEKTWEEEKPAGSGTYVKKYEKVADPFDSASTDPEITKTAEIDCSGKTSHNATICVSTDYFEKEKADYIFKVQVKDKAGNPGAVVEEPFSVDQSTDQPVITLTNANAAINDLTKMNVASAAGDTNNIFDTTDNKVLKFSVTDDDGIESVTVKYNVYGNATVTTNTIYSKTVKYPASTGKTSADDNYPRSKRFDYTLPSTKNLYDVQIEVVDCKGETTKYKSKTLDKFLVAVDDGAPTLTVTLPTKVVEKNSKHYVNSSFDATVKTKDDYSLESVTVTNGTLKTGTLAKDATEQTFTFTVAPTTANTTEEIDIQFATTDKFGQTNTETYTIVFDFNEPTFETGYPTYSSPSSATDWYDKTGQNVTVTPKAKDNKVLEGVYWATFDKTKGKDELNAVTDNSWTAITGAATNADATGGVTFGDGTSYLYIKVKDLAGNVTYSNPYIRNIDTEKPELTTLTNPTSDLLVNKQNDITVDVKVKDNDGGSGISKVEIRKATKDGAILATTETVADTDKLTLGTADPNGICAVAGKISKAKIEATKKGIFAVCFVVYDKAGNTATETVEIKIDEEKPTVEFTSHSTHTKDTQAVNKLIELKGTAKDNQSLKSLKLEIAVSSDGGTTWGTATELFNIKADDAAQTVLDGNVWTYNLQTNDTKYNGKKIKLTLTAVDKAENEAVPVSIVLNVDQNSDRPVITLDLNENGAITQNASINVKVDDDDAISGLKLKIAKGNTKPTNWNATSDNIQTVDLTNGSGTFTNDVQATTKLWFYVEDAAGGKFETAIGETDATKLYDVPYIKFTDDGTKESNTANISYTYDATKPTVSSVGFGFGDTSENALTGAQTGSGDNYSEWENNDAKKLKFGGTKKRYISLAVTPNDANGIKSVTGTGITGKTLTFTKVSPDASGKGNCVWYSNAIDLENVSDSTISVTVTDNSGLTQAATLNYAFSVDNAGPTVKMTSPTMAETKTGTIEVSGTCGDGDTGSGIDKFNYLVLNNPYYASERTPLPDATIISYFTGTALPTGGNEIKSVTPSGTSFSFSLSDLPATTAALANYSNVLHNAQNVYTMSIYFYLEDALGNSTLEKETFSYDPFGNRPSADVNYPTGPRTSSATESRTTVNGTVRLSGSSAAGSATGALTPAAVYIQLDVNNDGTFDGDDLDLLKEKSKDGFYQIGATDSTDGLLMYEIVEREAGLKTALELDTAATVDAQAIGDVSSFWGIKPKGSVASWFLTLNSNMEFQNEKTDISTATPKEGKEFLVGTRAVAIVKESSSKAIFGSWSDAEFFLIDTNIPVIGEKLEQVVEYVGTGTTVASERTYQQDMFLKGKSALQLSIAAEPLDGENDITKVKYYTAPTKAGLNDSNIATKNELTSLGTSKTYDGGKKGYDVTIPLSADDTASGALWVKVEAFKSNEASAYSIYNVNFDNTAPKINNLKFNSVIHKTADEDTHLIVNSNGKFTLGGQVEDGASGYERIGFYIVRGDADKYDMRMYDPMSTSKSPILLKERGTKNKTDLASGITSKTEGFDDSTVTDPEKKLGSSPQTMYGSTQKNVTVVDKLTLTLESTNPYIRSGGVVYIAGTYIKMAKVSNETVTLDVPLPETVTGTVEAFFPYMQFVDNTGSEKTQDDGLHVLSNGGDDGDEMPESIIKSQAKYDWDATIQSQNIPDGPCKVVIFAWDKAGNISAATYKASIQNNAPRLVKLHLGTDLNGNGKYSDNEFESYDILGEVGKQSSYKNMQTYAYKNKSFRVKDKLAVVPEFVGGNGVDDSSDDDKIYKGIKMVALTAAESDQTINTIKKDGVVSVGTGASATKLISSDATKFDAGSTMVKNRETTKIEETAGIFVPKRNNIWLFEIPSANNEFGGDAGESPAEDLSSGQGHRAVSFTFWDTTDDTIQGVDSSYCYLRISDLIIDVVDVDKPIVEIHPFYWNSKDDCSVPLDENDLPLGHIDLEDAAHPNPQVSGEVYIRGRAYDNTRHGTISMITPGTGEEHVVAKYYSDKVGAGWITAKRVGDTVKYSYKQKKSADGTTTIIELGTGTTPAAPNWSWPDNWLNFEITSDGRVTQDGHEVEWCFTVNMTPYGVKDSQSVYAYATDAQNNDGSKTTNASNEIVSAMTTSITQTGSTKDAKGNVIETARYEMDFVPYIKSVESVASANYTVRRSRLGRYPVRAGAKIRINGMNFAVGAAYSVAFYKTNTTGKQGDKNSWTAPTGGGWSGTIPGDGYIEITVPNYSCFVEVTVNNVKTPNNTNSNDEGYNIQKGKFRLNRETNKMYAIDDQPGDDFWTDDCYLSVWNVAADTLFPGSINPHSGVIKKIDKYNSGSGAPSNAGQKNPSAAPAPGGGYLYKQNGYATAVDPVTGMNDSYYAAISSDDLKLYGYASGKTYASHGDNIAFNSSEVAYVAPVDEMDYTIVNGMPYYVFQDNGLGGDSGSVWGLGLVMMREGIWYDRSYFNPYKGNTIEEAKLPYFVERQGYNEASHARDSSGGYDSVLYQFKNPRIAGWYNSDDSLLYQTKDGGGTVTGVDYIYISYFDSYAKCLKYAAYRVGHRFASNDSKYSNAILKEWGKMDVDHDIDIVAEMSSSPNTKGNQSEQKTYDHMTDGASVVAGNDTTSNNPTPSVIAGEWSDILVDPSDHMPIIVYYNKTAKSLEIARGANAFPQSKDDWNYTKAIKPKGTTDFGRYVSAAIDNAGNLHIAAQDADSAKLYYVYRTKASGYASGVSAAVDGSSGAGRWTDIELTNPAGTTVATIKPVISYINTGFLGTTSGVKVAYLESVEGTDSNAKLHFEAMTDPAQYTAGDQRTSVMADVKETKAGSIKAPVAVGFNSDKLALDFLRGEE